MPPCVSAIAVIGIAALMSSRSTIAASLGRWKVQRLDMIWLRFSQ